MRRLRIPAYITLFLVFFLFLPANAVRASGEFQADYDVQYAISPEGKTIVTQHVTLTNKRANFYPKQYSLLIDSDRITNVIAYDDGGVITPAISVKDGKTEIGLTFNTKTIGLGKSSTFSLRYEHAGIASQNGSIWEVYIPGITNDPDINTYRATLSVPPTFGPAAYVSPLPADGNTWTKDQMIHGGISAAYGTAQNYLVTLRYTLSNPGLVPQVQTIALPPDTAYQKVTMSSLIPKPNTVTRDTDGNWLAQYTLLPAQTISITSTMTVAVFLSPRKDFVPPPTNLSDYLKPQKYWEVTDPKIQSLAKTYTTPREIYDYVAGALTYNYQQAQTASARLGAAGVLAHPTDAVCTEFTDLFIAIARAAGIPARRNVGYAYTDNPKLRPILAESDILHAWPEYYDAKQNLWIPVDPTWANTTGGADYFTKLDFNHIVFAINGTESTLPYPAGFYHGPDQPAKDINVTFAPGPSQAGAAKITGAIDFPSQIGAGTKPTGALVVTNSGSTTAYTIPVSVVAIPGNVHITQIIPVLLPFATVRIPFTVSTAQTLQSLPGNITAQVNDTTLHQQFTVRPILWLIAAMAVFTLAAGAVLVYLAKTFVWKLFRKH